MPRLGRSVSVQSLIDRSTGITTNTSLSGPALAARVRAEQDDLLRAKPLHDPFHHQGSVVDKRLEIRAARHGIPVPLDVVVTSPDDFAWRKDVVGTIEWPAAREGKVLYSVTPTRVCGVLSVHPAHTLP